MPKPRNHNLTAHALLTVNDGRVVADHRDVHSDCDSEGNEPPKIGAFVPPSAMENILAPPPRTNAELKLPFSAVRNRLRYRSQFESKLYYEEWVEGEGAEIMAEPSAGHAAHTVKKLEPDSDFPVGKPYFWHAVCPPCNIVYHPHVPSGWSCPVCKGRVWQLPDDPESKACAVCQRKLAKIRIIAGRRLQSPIALNGHNCKRCGRVVCDDCYNPNPVALEVYGFTQPQKVCVDCVKDVAQLVKPPEDDDNGAMQNDEYALKGLDEAQLVQPFWPPHCSQCNVYLGQPPPRWECRTCGEKVWQPTESPHSTACWICKAQFPKVRCHCCGQLVCDKCGAFAQPLPLRGYDTGEGLTVCRGCYGGISFAQNVIPDDILEALNKERNLHRRGGPQRAQGMTRCVLCTSPCTDGVRQNCALCGWLCCLTCTQYKQPSGAANNGPSAAVCTMCFDPRVANLPDHRDNAFWPPKCVVCLREWQKPPERWRCPFNCGNVWQPFQHVASKACSCCGKATGSTAINCRCCGRIVCAACGSETAEVPELGFTKGARLPRCPRCKGAAPLPASSTDESSKARPTSASPPRATSPGTSSRGRGGASPPGRGRGGPPMGRGGQPGRGGGSPPNRGGSPPSRGRGR